jgi:hypothetical protein
MGNLCRALRRTGLTRPLAFRGSAAKNFTAVRNFQRLAHRLPRASCGAVLRRRVDIMLPKGDGAARFLAKPPGQV